MITKDRLFEKKNKQNKLIDKIKTSKMVFNKLIDKIKASKMVFFFVENFQL